MIARHRSGAPAPASKKSLILTRTHIAILFTILRLGGCTTQHVVDRGWFGTKRRNHVRADIKKLEVAGLIARHRLPPHTGVGTGQHFLLLTRSGREELKAFGEPADVIDSSPTRPPLLTYQHDIGIRNFAIVAERACQSRPGVSLVEWVAEHQLRLNPIKILDPTDRTTPTLELVPDAAFTVELASGAQKRFFLEFDADTVRLRRLRERLRAYLIWLPTQAKGSPVLWLVPTRKRQEQIAALTRDEAAKLGGNARLIWIAQVDQIAADSVLTAPIWQVVGGSTTALLPMSRQVG